MVLFRGIGLFGSNNKKYSFQRMKNFKLFVANVNQNNNMDNEIKFAISAGNIGYYALGKLLISKWVSRHSKKRLYSNTFWAVTHVNHG